MKFAYQFKQKIDNIFLFTSSISDDEIKSALVKYLCVLISGYLELNLKEIILDYATNKSSPIIQNYIEYSIQNITNLKTTKIIDILRKFNKDWGTEIENLISPEQKDAVDAVIANRNNIAHGKDVGLSYVRIKDYYKRIQEVIDKLENTVS